MSAIKEYLFQCFDKDPEARGSREHNYLKTNLQFQMLPDFRAVPWRLVS